MAKVFLDELEQNRRLQEVEITLGVSFKNRELLIEALTHSSYANEKMIETNSTGVPIVNNERFEFLGDAVIGLVVARLLMDKFPDAAEGKLSRWRSQMVSRKTLAELANDWRFGDCIFLGRGERRTGGSEKRSILAGVLEAIIGGLYMDSGMAACEQVLTKLFAKWLSNLEEKSGHLAVLDQKTHLQERTQQLYKTTPVYRVVEAWGAEHEKYFRVEILIDKKVIALGDGRSKKDAEQQAAFAALQIIGF